MARKAIGTWKINKIEYGDKPLIFDAVALACVRQAMKKSLNSEPESDADPNLSTQKIDQRSVKQSN